MGKDMHHGGGNKSVQALIQDWPLFKTGPNSRLALIQDRP